MNAGRVDRRWRFGCCAIALLALLGTTANAVPLPPRIDEQRYDFHMTGKPWKDVFAWLTEQTGMPVAMVALPPGFAYYGCIKPGYKPTISEVIDVINDGLEVTADPQKFMLIRRKC